jgi:hypothetical protein
MLVPGSLSLRTYPMGRGCLLQSHLIFWKQFLCRLSFMESFQSVQLNFHSCDYISFHTHISSVYGMFNLTHIITITSMTGTGRVGNKPNQFSESVRLSWREQKCTGAEGGGWETGCWQNRLKVPWVPGRMAY